MARRFRCGVWLSCGVMLLNLGCGVMGSAICGIIDSAICGNIGSAICGVIVSEGGKLCEIDGETQ